MRILTQVSSVVLIALSIVACQSGGSDTGKMITPSGYSYTVHEDVAGDVPSISDWSSFSITVQGDDGKVIQKIPAGPNMPAMQMIAKDAQKGKPNPIDEVLRKASVGDSITIIMPIDSLGQPGNPQWAGLKHLEYVIRVEKVQSDTDRITEKETLRIEEEAKAEIVKKKEPEIAKMIAQTLKDYKSGKLKTETVNGVDVIVHEEGDGTAIAEGKTASMQYYGVLKSDGSEFDNSFKRGRPYTFSVGKGEVIKGWDLGLVGLKKGSTATIFIPYTMAYGEAGRPGIPEKSDLVFYVEVEDVK